MPPNGRPVVLISGLRNLASASLTPPWGCIRPYPGVGALRKSLSAIRKMPERILPDLDVDALVALPLLRRHSPPHQRPKKQRLVLRQYRLHTPLGRVLPQRSARDTVPPSPLHARRLFGASAAYRQALAPELLSIAKHALSRDLARLQALSLCRRA
jgi:hypothetical protein